MRQPPANIYNWASANPCNQFLICGPRSLNSSPFQISQTSVSSGLGWSCENLRTQNQLSEDFHAYHKFANGVWVPRKRAGEMCDISATCPTIGLSESLNSLISDPSSLSRRLTDHWNPQRWFLLPSFPIFFLRCKLLIHADDDCSIFLIFFRLCILSITQPGIENI
jgi:hypothetical protein